ncbi:MAG TPA: M12 family metallo-peptidase, partial [Hymenobacter sp.]|nr:M12 family metallo-peptidase [Hymenobacter sp.]
MRFSTLPKSIAIVALALFSSGAFAQNQPNQIALWLQSFEASHQLQTVSVLEHTELASRALPTEDADYLTLDNDQLASLFENKPAVIDFVIPRNGGAVNLTLARVNITSDDFSVNTNDESNVAYKNGVHYRGIVNGDENSIAALSFYDGEVMGFYNNAQGNYTVGKVEGEQDVMVVYNSKQLENPEAWGCFTADSGAPVEYTNDGNDNRDIGCKTVKVYFECDYALFTNKGSSTTNVSNYVTGLFNQVATLYANENVDIQISEIYVWTTTDPYVSHTSTSAVLSAFKANKGTNFNGNLAHFLTTRSLGGGIAYVDVICSKSYAFGVSAISSSYNSVPTYSWTIEVVTHELGHNLGSPHTQSCSWTGGALDNCYAVEGSCSPGPAPINGGTIMSYCHMTSTGINFNNGFGSQPGNLIRSRVLNATCLTSSGTAPTGLTTTNIATEAAVLTWVAVPGATQYTVQYKPAASSTWITAGNTAGISYSLSGLSAGTDYNWQVKTDCSAYAAAASFATTTNTVIPTCANVTGLFATNVGTSSASLSWSAVS